MVWLYIYLSLISVVTFCAYGLDKFRARCRSRRIRESTLHTLALLGGTAGAFAGQIVFRHKTRDRRFQAVFVLIVLFQAALVTFAFVLR